MLLHSYSDRDLRNQNLSHITAGYITNSPSLNIVLADEASDSGLASSLFNYANTTQDGLVDNTMSTYSSSSSNVEIWRGYVNSGFPLFGRDFLVTNDAIFGGLVKRRFNEGNVASVSSPKGSMPDPRVSDMQEIEFINKVSFSGTSCIKVQSQSQFTSIIATSWSATISLLLGSGQR